MKSCSALLVGCFLSLAGPALATTWAPSTVTCPACGAENEFAEVASFGSYIYMWPSRFQYIFWPRIDSQFLYTCTSCGYSAYMWDFAELPADKQEAVAAAIEGALPSGPWDSYTDIPMPERLALAERSYRLLERDDFFWCEYYRILGYHLEEAGRAEEAAAARRRALELAEALAGREQHAGVRKELLLVSGAMRHFLGDQAGALADLDAALALTFEDPAVEPAQNANVDEFLTSLLKDYQVELGEVPAGGPEPAGEGATDGGSAPDPAEQPDAGPAVGGGSTVRPVEPTARGCACSIADPVTGWTPVGLLLVPALVLARLVRRRRSRGGVGR
jgi:MYXO-CTERM domain-containing protein